MCAIQRVTIILLALLSAAAAAVSHKEYLKFEETDLDLQGVVANATSKSDCECRRSCQLTLSCSKLSRFQDAACFTEKPDSAYRHTSSLEVTKGPDGLYYTEADATKMTYEDCQSQCDNIPGFRRPIMKKLATQQFLQSRAGARQVWLGLRRLDDGYRWDDGTSLDRTTLNLSADEPVENHDNLGYVMWSTKKIDDVPTGGKYHCSCQADLDNIKND